MLKKALIYLVVAFAVYSLVATTDTAAEAVRGAGEGLSSAGTPAAPAACGSASVAPAAARKARRFMKTASGVTSDQSSLIGSSFQDA